MNKKVIAEIFNQMADFVEKGEYSKKIRVGITTLGSEHGSSEIILGARMAQERFSDVEVVLIGDRGDSDLKCYEAKTLEECHKIMEDLLDRKELDACVTMHYNFPLGVATVGRVVTPAKGKELLIATTTGTAAFDRIEAMVRNAVYGNIVAKALGIKKPRIGILNVDGARQVERILLELRERGYDIDFATSIRQDGGLIMRGNDLLSASCDVMVTDTLTGNIIVKILSAYTTGGDYEALGYGYGPGIGENYERLILILSRASGASVAANAIRFAADLVKGNIFEIASKEFELVRRAGFDDVIKGLKGKEIEEKQISVKIPEKKPVTEEISGIDVLELEDMVKLLWKNGIYAESGMGCTGPVILVSKEDYEKALEILNRR
ncbi:glycine/sarcosine/betaine reductase complex protein C subunit alpha [Caldanaerobacter subterraneus subsp. yonseiensis KB-1]|uniref:Glycine/sarcosine/betaine reductase complex protein C subunit alpha n=1 Tax=Caldanaerobacter subterraneus subsp. yonseiensis KB-1 TaxID=1388761 RepID=U5CYR1_CALSX|nr:glycine/sarcosine/betaine reductase complex component C subunit alpha [Caldanaerobacter subterraneus]ERM93127.1 glycine/sarcosine/betaine reductase complex protein C subunit alpha [Caldanaerobacter subterraneus subsp. yonseiensis KB-1]